MLEADSRASQENESPLGDSGIEFRRRPSYNSPASWNLAASRNPTLTDLNLAAGEEERLADEWGLSEAISRAASDTSEPLVGTADLLGRRLSSASDAILLSKRHRGHGAEPDLEEEDMEVIETRSEPGLSRPKSGSFIDEVLGDLETRLKTPRARPAAGARPSSADDEPGYALDGPRVKILERTPTQRRRQRPESRATAHTLSFLEDITGDGSVGDLSDPHDGIASRDSLFRGNVGAVRRASTISSTYSMNGAQPRPSSIADELVSYGSRPASRLSMPLAGGRTTDAEMSDAALSPTEARDSTARPTSSMSVYTSRFDPAVIAAQREELAKDRPKFVDPDAGRPPQVVLLPAPLAGQPAVPVQPVRPDGPEPEVDADSTLLDESDEDLPPGLVEPKRPAGALYGRSLLDVMAERKALLKAQVRAYVPGSDGRRQMFDLHAEPGPSHGLIDQIPSAGLVQLASEYSGDDQPRRQTGPPRVPLAERKAVQSIFGPDTLYQRESAIAKQLDAAERKEREAQAELEALRRDEAEQKKVRKKLRKGAKTARATGVPKSSSRASAMSMATQGGTEVAALDGWMEPLELAAADRHADGYGETGAWLPDSLVRPICGLTCCVLDFHPIPRQEPRHSVAPSLSVPGGLNSGMVSSTSEWLLTPEQRDAAARARDNERAEEDADDEEGFRPRPLSALAQLGPRRATPLRRTFSFETDSEHPAGGAGTAELAARHLPLPGEPSSIGHGTPSIADTEDDRPIGERYLRAVDGGSTATSEDDQPLGKRYSRLSLPHFAAGPPLVLGDAGDVDASDTSNIREVPSGASEQSHLVAGTSDGRDDDEDEDDAPLGARYSTVLPDTDDVPLALHRLSLAPAPLQHFAPHATIRPLDEDGRTVSGDSDDEPLGLRTAQPAYPSAPFYGGLLSASGPTFPPYSTGAPYLGMPTGPMPYYPPVAVPAPYSHPFPTQAGFAAPAGPQMQLAMAEMQMQAAMGSSQAATMGPAGASIDRWRKSVQS